MFIIFIILIIREIDMGFVVKLVLLLLFSINLAISVELYPRGIWNIYHKDTQNIKISNPNDLSTVVLGD